MGTVRGMVYRKRGPSGRGYGERGDVAADDWLRYLGLGQSPYWSLSGFHSGSEHVSIRARIRPTRTRLPMPRYRTISNGNGTCPSARSVAPGHVHIIPWLIQHGCRMVDGLCTITVENGDLPILTSCIWLQKAMRSNHLIRSPTMYLDR